MTGESERLVGEYERNYPSLFRTFWHFRLKGKHLALYSRDYTCTRIMEIVPGNGIRDIGGEEPRSSGFCPTDYFVPQVKQNVFEDNQRNFHPERTWEEFLGSFPPGCWYESAGKRTTNYQEPPPNSSDKFKKRLISDPDGFRTGHISYPQTMGFVAGCFWGDDSSWKFQYLDLSRADEGILKRYERFGYLKLPDKMTLEDAIDARYAYDAEEDGTHQLRITSSRTYSIETGLTLDPYR